MEEQELKQEIVKIDDQVKAVVVNSKESYESASTVVIGLDGLKKKIEAYWKDPIEKAFQSHKALTAKRAEMLKPVEERRRILTGKISAYLTEQDRIRREEQRRADEERRKREDAERAKFEKRAEKAEERGDISRAAAFREKADDVYVPPVVVQSEVEKTTHTDAGTISAKPDINVIVTEPMKILKAIVAGTLPIGIISINEAKLKQAVKLSGLTELEGCIIEKRMAAQFRSKSA